MHWGRTQARVVQGADRGGFSLAVDAVSGGIGRTQAHKKCAMTAIDARVVIRASLGESVKGKNRTICEERQLLDGSGGFIIGSRWSCWGPLQ